MKILDTPETSCPYAVGTLCLIVGTSDPGRLIGRTCVITEPYGLRSIFARNPSGELELGLSWSYAVSFGNRGVRYARHAWLRPIVPPQAAAELRDEPATDRVAA